ncbi:(2,3-dihydroxybenzoyl)adenylate synthase [uncultured Gordonia sp.]|uniref:(2,3-dihydroxybenzoyl)adenylate synthase n=2 Tax=Gordonia TaxID=2053 RepID=UPI00260C929B|nr:AMP-binding protein [uncultured Gordonia sp.]
MAAMSSPDNDPRDGGATLGLTDGFLPLPAQTAQRYQSEGLFDDRPLSDLVAASALRNPSAVAVIDSTKSPETVFSYADLMAAADRRAAGFAAAGLRAGDRVVLQLPNSAEFAVTLLSLLRLGVAPVMALPAHRIAEIAHLAAGAGAVAYISADVSGGFDYRELAADLQRAVTSVRHVFIAGDPGPYAGLPEADGTFTPASPDPDAPALFLVSGGTTGLPKLIARSHNDYAYNARVSAQILQLRPDDAYLVVLPAAHNFPLCCPGLLGVFATGGRVVFTDNPSPDNTFDLIERHRITVTALVPALAQVWCAATEWEPADISSLRVLQVGGAKLAQPDAEALDAALGPVVQQVFGMAEGLICYTRLDDDRTLVTTVQGRPMSEFDEVRVVDEDGHDVPDGTEGELLVRGPYTIRGYYRAPEHNARSFTSDGFYRSGDRVTRRPDGYLAVTGRIKDTIVRAGENVAADDVEEHLLAHPAVGQVAVVGLPDDALGERICAAIVVAPGHPRDAAPDRAALRQFLTDRGLATFKMPDQVAIVGSLPVTAVGKIDKRSLTTTLLAAQSS